MTDARPLPWCCPQVLPGWHRRGLLPKVEHAGCEVEGIPEGEFFGHTVRPGVLPPEPELARLRRVYRLSAGMAATHSNLLPHYSFPNSSGTVRRVLTCHFMRSQDVQGRQLPRRTYTSYKDRSPFRREYFLVRGRDVHGHGLRASPFD